MVELLKLEAVRVCTELAAWKPACSKSTCLPCRSSPSRSMVYTACCVGPFTCSCLVLFALKMAGNGLPNARMERTTPGHDANEGGSSTPILAS